MDAFSEFAQLLLMFKRTGVVVTTAALDHHAPEGSAVMLSIPSEGNTMGATQFYFNAKGQLLSYGTWE